MREIPLTQFERDLYGIEHLWVEDELRHHTTPGKDGCEQMTDQRISTEEAERVAGEVKETARRLWKWDQWLDDAAAADRAAAALRSLAAERDELEAQMIRELLSAEKKRLTENERLREALRPIIHEYDLWAADVRIWDLDRLCAAITTARAALGEEDRA